MTGIAAFVLGFHPSGLFPVGGPHVTEREEVDVLSDSCILMKELLVFVFAIWMYANPPQVVDATNLVFREVLGA